MKIVEAGTIVSSRIEITISLTSSINHVDIGRGLAEKISDHPKNPKKGFHRIEEKSMNNFEVSRGY